MNKIKHWFPVLLLLAVFLPSTAQAAPFWTISFGGWALNGNEQVDEANAIWAALPHGTYWGSSWYRNSYYTFLANGYNFTVNDVNIGPNITIVHEQDWAGIATNACVTPPIYPEGAIDDSDCNYYVTLGYGQVVTLGITLPPTNGVCGTANGRTYPYGSSGYSPYNQCSSGSSNNTAFPSPGGQSAWLCSGTNGGSWSPMCSAWQSAPSSCSATTIGNCTLPSTSSGSSAGSCAAGYSSGSCSYSCSNGTWSQTSNSCASSSCSATTIGNCTLPSTSSGSSAGSCSTGYAGSCNYSCADGTWSQTSNSCVLLSDLIVATPNVSPASVTPGQAVSLSSVISNLSSGSAVGSFPNIFRINTSSLVGGTSINGLAGNGSANTTASFTPSSVGTYTVSACTDNNTSWQGSVAESNENNNCSANASFTVAWPPLSASCSGTPGDPFVGQPVAWGSTVSGGSGNRAYSWSGTDSLSGASASVQKSYSTIGTKTAAVTVTDTVSGQTASASCNSGSGVTVSACTASLSSSPDPVQQGQNTTLTWSVTGGSLCAASCTGSGFNTGGATSGSAQPTVVPAPPSTSYALTCSGGTYGPPPPVNTTVTVLVPTVTVFTVNNQSGSARVNPRAANNVNITWSTDNSSTCSVTKNGVAWKTGLSSSGITDSVTAQTVYDIDCSNDYGTHATASIIVNVIANFREF